MACENIPGSASFSCCIIETELISIEECEVVDITKMAVLRAE